MNQIESQNEFVIRFGNVNGTGSASANGMVAKSFFRLGLPIGPKNMFPSNIQGLPTWYEVRVSEKGYTGRRGGVDIMVAMNPQTFAKDIESLNSGGYLIYDSTKVMRGDLVRKDIQIFGVPITEMIRNEFPNPKMRGMLKNMVYVGALAAMLDVELEVYFQLVREQFAGKEKLHEPNFKALKLGYGYAQEHFNCPIGITVKASTVARDKVILGGNEAAGLGCVYGGATVAAWYPITPSTSLVDAFTSYCHKFRRDPEDDHRLNAAIIQAEDEIAAAGMVLGAAWNGARSFTATSGPGVSLMSEFIGYAYYAEIPAVIFNIQRCGPSTGMPTRTQQADLLMCAYASHGDTKHVMLFPSNPKECFEMAAQAFELAELLQTVVFVMSDLELGMNDYVSEPLTWTDGAYSGRGRVLGGEDLEKLQGPFYRYLDHEKDGIPTRTYPGVHPKGAYFTRGSGHDRYGRYTEDGDLYKDNLDRIGRKFETAVAYLPKAEATGTNHPTGVICLGTTMEPMPEALQILRDQGIKIDCMRLRSFPFGPEVDDFIRNHEKLIVVEQNRDRQLRQLLVNEFDADPKRLHSVLCYDGLPVMASTLVEEIGALVKQGGTH